jgi:hypothetical protein
MADDGCTNYFDVATQLFSNDPTRLYGPIGRALRAKVPYLSLLRSGTFPSQVSATLVSVLQTRPFMGTSLAAPSFTGMQNLCGSCTVPVDQTGTNQYPYVASIADGVSDKICMNQGFSAFTESLTTQLDSLQSGAVQVFNADVRYQLYLNSGVKCVVQSTQSIDNMIVGGENQIAVPVPAVESDSQLDFETLQLLNEWMQENVFAEVFDDGNAKFIGSIGELNKLRNDLGGAAGPGGANIVPLGQVAAGGNAMAIKALTGYAFTPTYRGIDFGLDPRPLRLNWTGGGYQPVNPDVANSATVGTGAVTSNDWMQASHEVGFLMYKDSFERQVPAAWTGEGKVRFDRQMWGGEIQFMNHPDTRSNLWGDWGVLAWRIGRAYRPLRPWFVLPIIYKRCKGNTQLTTCTGISGA